jgi:positive regulator of sigma E activity
MKRYSAFLLMLGNVLLVAILTWTNGKLDESTVAGVLTALLLTVLAFLLLARPQ